MPPPSPEHGRLFLVSNRLPLTLREEEGRLRAEVSAGGLATGLVGLHRESGGRWIGWPGITTDDGTTPEEVQRVLAEEDMRGVSLTPEEHERYYGRISNQCIWPLFHYFTERVHFDTGDWEVYESVNRKFADAVLEEAGDEDVVFVQDFHLMLVPEMLRRARPDLRIGFFLHIPFPSSEVFRVFPMRERLLRGVLGADLVAFHTMGYVRHFRSAVRSVLGLETRTTEVHHDGRVVGLRAQPLAINAWEWEPRDGDEERRIEEHRRYLRRIAGDRKIVLGVERTDYTKGIPERLAAYRELLAEDPGRVDRVMMIQVAVPSRVSVPDYQELKDEIDRLAGSINGEFGRPGLQPLDYLYQAVSPTQLRALYRSADVALVTPLRDGLNLVAKEYVASRLDDDGVLVLGESTGAAWELGEALRVNPFDVHDVVEKLKTALEMPLSEQRERMRPMRERVRQLDVQGWARQCLTEIRRAHQSGPSPRVLGERERGELQRAWSAAARRRLFLDYDGTLRELAPRPEDAEPGPEVLRTLRALTADAANETWVVSGRPPEVLEQWLGSSGTGLIAEHGGFLREPGAGRFEPLFDDLPSGWQDEVKRMFEEFVRRVPGSRVEDKSLGLAWHYRQADPVLGTWQARELFHHLVEVLLGQGLQVMRGHKVVEVRPAGLQKGTAMRRVLAHDARHGDLVLAAGDDDTDETMFRMAPEGAWTLLVGARGSAARHRVAGPVAMRDLLQELAASSKAPLGADQGN